MGSPKLEGWGGGEAEGGGGALGPSVRQSYIRVRK